MAEPTITEISVSDLPMSILSGSAEKRRALVAIRYTATGVTNTIALATYVPGVADIEGVVWDTHGDAVSGTALTWSGGTATTAGYAANRTAGEIGLIVNFT